MPSLTPSERIFLLSIGLVTLVGTGLARVAPHSRPGVFPGLIVRGVEWSEPGADAESCLPEEGEGSPSPEESGVAGAPSLLEAQIRRIEGVLDDKDEQADEVHPATRSRGAAASLDINRASAEELQGLAGIGPVLAERIVEYRATHGRFGSVEDLTRIKGIGPRTLDRLREHVEVAEP